MTAKAKLQPGHALGRPVKQRDLESHVTGATRYYDDMRVPRMLHLKIHRPISNNLVQDI